jgi:hypothetical protein
MILPDLPYDLPTTMQMQVGRYMHTLGDNSQPCNLVRIYSRQIHHFLEGKKRNHKKDVCSPEILTVKTGTDAKE